MRTAGSGLRIEEGQCPTRHLEMLGQRPRMAARSHQVEAAVRRAISYGAVAILRRHVSPVGVVAIRGGVEQGPDANGFPTADQRLPPPVFGADAHGFVESTKTVANLPLAPR
jgi:hypothetical protein